MVDVVIVGAGLSGLVCGQLLEKESLSCLFLEASDDVGGRIRTDEHQGFLLDRGFQVVLTAYPETRKVLDLDALHLQAFEPGALVHYRGKLYPALDPIRDPRGGFKTLLSPVGTLLDKLRVGRLKADVALKSADRLLKARAEEMSTEEWLQDYGFSSTMIERFFRPFFSGVFLERELQTASSFFQFTFKMFSEGEIALPEAGIGQITRQLAARMPASAFRFGARVAEIRDHSVLLETGEEIRARYIVVATDRTQAERLLPDSLQAQIPWKSTCTVYFAAPRPPVESGILILNGDGQGILNHVVPISQVSPRYSSNGEALIAANVVGIPFHNEESLLRVVRQELVTWFGATAWDWRHLRTYVIPEALCAYDASNETVRGPRELPNWLKICGDHVEVPSQEGAVRAGKKAAESILAEAATQRRGKVIRFPRERRFPGGKVGT